MSYEIPIAFFIWRRPELTEKVFARISEIKPNTLIIIADGYQDDDLENKAKCLATRQVVSQIDWPCNVHRQYADQHIGLQNRVETGLDYVFSIVDRAIILEDDCLPEQTFFDYLEFMLNFYENDERIACISGDKPPCIDFDDSSYAFTIYPMIWGWATWKRVWLTHDRHMNKWPSIRNSNFILDKIGSQRAAEFWQSWFDKQYLRENNSWAIGFTFTCLINNMLSIIPKNNLIKNIGFGVDSTHTFDSNDPRANAFTSPMSLPLVHPSSIATAKIDSQIEQTVFSGDTMAHYKSLLKQLQENSNVVMDENYYLSLAEQEINKNSVNWNKYHNCLAASKLLPQNKIGLIIGCNYGEECKDFIDFGARYIVGIDPIHDIGKNYIDHRVTYHTAYAERLPLADESVDFIYSFSTFQHIDGLGAAYREAYRVLRPGGIIRTIASPLWNSRTGPHWGSDFAELNWLHLRVKESELIEFLESSKNPIFKKYTTDQIKYFLDPRHFNRRFARDYIISASICEGWEILENEILMEDRGNIDNEIIEHLNKIGYSQIEIFGVTHSFLAKKSM